MRCYPLLWTLWHMWTEATTYDTWSHMKGNPSTKYTWISPTKSELPNNVTRPLCLTRAGDTRIQQTYLKISRPQGNLPPSWWLWELGNEGFQNWWWPRIMMIHWVTITLWLILHDLGWSFWTLFFGSQVIRFSNPQIISRHLNWVIDL